MKTNETMHHIVQAANKHDRGAQTHINCGGKRKEVIMKTNETIQWQATQQKRTLYHIVQAANKHGVHYVHIAGKGLQPVVVLSLQRWCELQRK